MKVSLTSSQEKAFQVNQSRVLVSAGAGSGKTRVLVERFVRLVQQKQAKLDEVLLVTFTDKAAKEMRERILKRFEEEQMESERDRFDLAAIGTIHSFCARLLMENQLLVPISGQFHILDQALQQELLERVLSEKLDEAYQSNQLEWLALFESYGFSSLLSGMGQAFSQLKSLGLEPQQLTTESAHQEKMAEINLALAQVGLNELKLHESLTWEELQEWSSLSFGRSEGDKKRTLQSALELAWEFQAEPIKNSFLNFLQQIWIAFEAEKQKQGWVGFDDFQVLTRNLLRDHPEVRQRYQKRYKFIMVDEYQDTNPLQVEILDLLRSGENDYVVGDKKQAIYGFRHASISGFNDLEKIFSEGEGAVFDLDENFRSAPEILQFVNTFFNRVWNNDTSVTYRPLISPNQNGESVQNRVEIALVDQEPQGLSLKQVREMEAKWLAGRIQQLVQTKEAAYSDIVILIRSTSVLETYEKELAEAGIPFFLVSGRGFYAQQEIFDISHLLKVLAFPQSDIPLAGFLRSPFVGLKDETLALVSQWTKEKDRETPLWKGIKNIEHCEVISESEKEKIVEMLQKLALLEEKKSLYRFSQLIEKGIALFEYGVKSLCFFDGPQRLANIQKLMKVASEYENKQPQAQLTDFIAYLDRLESEEGNEEEASLEEELGDVVRIMTMHKSKGLEFPIVFAVDLGRSDLYPKGDFRFSSQGEFALKVRNPLTNQKEKPYWFNQLHDWEKQKELDEKKRLFYVVATRAQQRLILVGSTKFKAKKESFSPSQSWADWLRHLLQLNQEEEGLPEGTTFHMIEPTFEKREEQRAVEVSIASLPQDLQEWDSSNKGKKTVLTNVVNQFSVTQLMHYQQCPYRYSLLYDLGWVAKGLDPEKEEMDEERPLSAQSLGTLVHKTLEVIPFDEMTTELDQKIKPLFPKLNSKQKKEIEPFVFSFTQMPIYSDILKAKAVFKEWPFLISVGEAVIEGTIDLLFINEKDELVVADYKTNKLSPSSFEHKVETYRFQLELYLWAVRHFFKKISSFHGALLFLRKEKLVSIEAPVEGEGKIENLLQRLLQREFTPTPSQSICRDCSAKQICSFKHL